MFQTPHLNSPELTELTCFVNVAVDLEARIEVTSETMVDSYSSRIRGDGEEISLTKVKYSGWCFLRDKECVFQTSSRLDLVVQLDLVMCKNHPGGTGFKCMKLS